MNIFVGNLSRQVSEEDLKSCFMAYGCVSSVVMTGDSCLNFSAPRRNSQYTRREAQGYAYIEMPDQTEALAAILGVQGTQIGGLVVTVVEAKPMEKKKPRAMIRSNRR